MKILFNISIITVLLSVIWPCDCASPPSPEEAYELADAVFSGEVTNIVEDWNNLLKEVTIDVYDVWKGSIGSQIIILTGIDDGICGYNFQVNEEYLIYGNYSGDYIWTNICTRTNLLTDAEEDIDYLNGLNNNETSIEFGDNLRVTNTVTNQKFPEAAIDGNGRLHLTWVSIDGSNKNIMYTSSDDAGDTFADPIQINYVDDNIVAFGQSGPLIKIRGNEIFIVYTDDRNGYTSIFANISNDLGLSWEQEILIADTEYLNAYHDLEIHTDGSIHFIYYNFGVSNNLENVKYRYAENDISQMSPSIALGISTAEMAPCHCCQPDMEVGQTGDVYVVYRNSIQNIRDTYLAVKRYSDNTFTEYYQVSDTQDFINHCPSSGPSVKINNDNIAIAYTSYSHQNAYISISTLDELNFSDYLSLNPISTSFQNYPDIFLDNNVHSVWVDFDNWDIYYGMRDSETNTMVNIQKINDDTDAINSTESDPVICKDEEYLYSFWSDQRHSHYEIYFSRATTNSLLLGDLNSDGVINILDVVGLVNIILGISPENPAGDLNQDGVYNVLDIVQLVNIILDN